MENSKSFSTMSTKELVEHFVKTGVEAVSRLNDLIERNEVPRSTGAPALLILESINKW